MSSERQESCPGTPESDSPAYGHQCETDAVAPNARAIVPGECFASRRSGDESLAVRAEFVAVGGSEGEALEANQLAVIQEILLWLHRHNAPAIPAE